MTYTARFFGGPLNGQTREIPRFCTHVVVPAFVPPIASVWWGQDPNPSDSLAFQEGVYRLERLGSHQPGRLEPRLWDLFVYDGERERIFRMAPTFVNWDLQRGPMGFNAEGLAASLANRFGFVDGSPFDARPDFCWRCDATTATTGVGLCKPCHTSLSDNPSDTTTDNG